MENLILEKQKIIEDNQEDAIAAINKYLDRIYDLRDKFFDDEMNLKEGLEHDEKAETLLRESIQEAEVYEKVRAKLIKKDFNLSLYEINIVALSLLYVNQVWGRQINMLKKAVEESAQIIEALFKGENIKDKTSILLKDEES